MRNEHQRLDGEVEIDVLELIRGLWGRRLLIFGVTALVTALAIAYALLATPIYRAKVSVQPPSQNDIAQLNYGRGGDTGLAMLSVKEVFEVYLRNLQSESLRREFFRDVYLAGLRENERGGSRDDLYNRFQTVLSVGATKDTPPRYYVEVLLPDPQQAADWVTRYIELAGEHGKSEIIQNAMTDAAVKANNLEQQIVAARDSTKKQREDEIVRLSEALRVARSIGLDNPPIISNDLSKEVSAGMEGSLVYMRGTRALEAELENLRTRVSDDPFIDRLRLREEELRFYRALQPAKDAVQVYRQDGAIQSPDKPVKPQKLMIVVLGLVTGLVSGVVLALLAILSHGVRRRAVR